MQILFRFLFLGLIALLLVTSCCKDDKQNVIPENSDDLSLIEISINEMQDGYDAGAFTTLEVVQHYLNRIANYNKKGPELNAIITVNPDAEELAKKLDEERSNGKIRGPLHGIPVVLKDNIDTYDMPTTAGSRALEHSLPPDDSFLAQQLRDAGAIILGKANLSEWANFRGQLSTSGWSAVGGQTKNPYVLSRNPCGSSSGSAVAVAANLSMLAIGTETNGSIVCPSHANGVVGIKPTVGLVSRDGIIPISFTQDIAGPIARTVKDAAICLGALTDIDAADSKTFASDGNSYKDYTQFLKRDGLEGKRIGYYTAASGRNFKVDTLMNRALDFMRSQGAEIVEIDKIEKDGTGGASFEVMLIEYKDGLNKYFASLGNDAPIKNLAQLIEFNKQDSVELRYFNQAYLEMANEKPGIDSDEYKEALEKLNLGSREEGIDRVMHEHDLDAIVAPTGSPAWKTDHVNGDSFQLGSSSPAAHAGYPNITVPMGFVDDLPVGISIFGHAWSEPTLLEIAYAFEQGTRHRRAPEFKK
ncbi:Glutamyl-tRNA(Gln) amidotransferase subunit A [Salinivirga cyanobacteriivorans]|uniref:Glutamyl-tRNA(Gln) amidotransferase subunit A n=1 Tax=Salinivirga cyanobacteriivorans TaxID=1307839 RepID=A0A0S2I4A8_9BACT|nr:amidase [Salinivirga cyanobacteriivorans]ALO17190.1 Glutamyl-tRNA(Gln) amidotransferase subunit A [Salinivirga cyanobacteriivorans]